MSFSRRRKRRAGIPPGFVVAAGWKPALLFLFLFAFGSQGGAQDLSSEELTQRVIERRAVEAVIWGMPAVNFDLMYQAMVRDAKARPGSNKIVYWSKLSDWKNQTLTPNPDAVYFMPFFD